MNVIYVYIIVLCLDWVGAPTDKSERRQHGGAQFLTAPDYVFLSNRLTNNCVFSEYGTYSLLTRGLDSTLAILVRTF